MDPWLEQLVADYVERRDSGERITPEQFAGEHLDAGHDLERALAALHELDSMFPAQASELPTRVGSYRVVEEIGRGGMGRVFRVEHEQRPGTELALKLLTAAASLDPRMLERFGREGEALRRLDHPGIVKVHELGDQGGNPYLVMDLVDGGSLAQVINRARQLAGAEGTGRAALLELGGNHDGASDAYRAAASLVAELARAVQAAHDQGVLHRDLKSGNALIRSADGRPVLIDFGLVGGDIGATLTGTGDVLGTPHFMAPEQARGERADPKSDVYALGAMLYELLTLQPPHQGNDAVAVLSAVASHPPVPPRRIDPKVPRSLDQIVRRAMAFRPGWRYASAADLATVLEAFVEGRALPKATLSLRMRAEDFYRRNRRALAVSGVIGLLAACGLLYGNHLSHAHAEAVAMAQQALATAAADEDRRHPPTIQASRTAAEQLLALAPGDPFAAYYAVPADDRPREFADESLAAFAGGERDLARSRNDERALARMRRAAEGLANDPLVTALLGRAALRAKDYDLAQRELATAARLLPDSAKVRQDLGWLRRAHDDFAAAATRMREAIERNPDNGELWFDLSRMLAYQGRAAGASGEPAQEFFEQGLAAIEEALPRKPSPRTTVLRTQAFLLRVLERYEEAIPIQRRLVASSPSAVTWSDLGSSLDATHRLFEARDAYLEALKLNPDDVVPLAHLAHLHSGGRKDEGCADCQSFFERHPETLDADLVERYSLRALEAERGSFQRTEHFARYCRRMGRIDELRDRIDALLGEDFDEQALGRLVKARKALVD